MGTKFKEYITRAYLEEAVNEIQSKYPNYKKLTPMGKDKILRKFHLVCHLMNTIIKNQTTKIEMSGEKRKRDSNTGSMSAPRKKVKRETMAEEICSILNAEKPRLGKDGRVLEEGEIGEEEMNEETEPLPGNSTMDMDMPYYDPTSPEGGYQEFMTDDNNYIEIDEEDIPFQYLPVNEEAKEDESFRFFCPLLLGVGPASINLKLQQLNITLSPSFPVYRIDIVDRENSKIIFLSKKTWDAKVASLKEKYGAFIEEGEEKNIIGVVQINIITGEVTSHNCNGLNVEAAIDFLAIRKKVLLENYPEMDIPDIDEEMLISSYVIEKREEWATPISIEADHGEKIDGEMSGMPESYPIVTLDDIIEGMENIFVTRKDKIEATWNGKILPFTFCKEFIFPNEILDNEILKTVVPQGEIEIIRMDGRDQDLITFVKAVQNIVKQNESVSSFSLIKVGKNIKKTLSLNNNPYLNIFNITEILGCVGWRKRGKRGTIDDEMRQKEYHENEKKAYPTWMEEIFINELGKSGYKCLSHINFDETTPSHPIDKVSAKCCEKMKSIFTSLNHAITVALYMNTCSRLGGAYLINISSENKSYSNIAGIPIIANVIRDGVTEKICTGIIFRGPHHVRDSTDKIGVVTMERIKKPTKMTKKGLTVKINGEFWFIAKNSFTKIAPTYGTYLHDLLFIPTNFMGDMILNMFKDYEDLDKNCELIIEENEDFLSHRMVEMGLMGLLGSSQEEGYFSGYRMLFMVLLELSRAKTPALIEKKGFFESLNECLLSNCYVLFLHGNVCQTLKFIKENIINESQGFEM